MIPAYLKEEHFRYQQPPREKILEFWDKFFSLVKVFSEKKDIPFDDIIIDKVTIYEICIRIDQRFDYYKYFHSDLDSTMIMSQTKETALICYWVLKYKPLSLNERCSTVQFSRNNHCSINEMLVLHMIESYALRYHKEKNTRIAEFFTPQNRENILYNFKHRDFSKEAFIMYVSTLVGILEL